MKVAFITVYFPKLTETFILDRITKLIDKGIEVSIIAIKDPFSTTFYEDKTPDNLIHENVIKYDLLKKTRYLGNQDPQNFYNIISEIKPDIIHFQWGFLAETLLQDSNPGKIPVLVNFHETQLPKSWNINENIKKYRNVFEKSTYIMPVTEYIAKWLVEIGAPKQKIKITYTGTNPDIFKPTLRKPKTLLDIVTNGSFIEKKGHEYTLHALRECLNQGINNFRILFIGSGILEEQYKSLIKSYQMEDKVVFLGRLKTLQVVQIYQNSDIFVLPSIRGHDQSEEGLPVALIEAMAMELPVISTKQTGAPEAIKHGQNGLLAQERNPFELAYYIKTLLEDSTLRLKMGKEGRKEVLKKFNINKSIDETITLYKTLCNKN